MLQAGTEKRELYRVLDMVTWRKASISIWFPPGNNVSLEIATDGERLEVVKSFWTKPRAVGIFKPSRRITRNIDMTWGSTSGPYASSVL